MAVPYVKGELTLEDAEQFERHYFGCDTCWQDVQRAIEIRAAMHREPSLRSTQTEGRSPRTGQEEQGRARRPRVSWRPIAAAAVLVLAIAWLWRFVEDRGDSRSSAMRAPQASLAVGAYTSGDALIATWQRLQEVHVYHVRLFGEDGELLLERDVQDTTVVVDIGEVSRAVPGRPLYWDVEGLNELRQVVARSGLRRIMAPARGAR